MTKITLKSIQEHEKATKSLQGKLLMQFDDEISSIPKDGFGRLLCASKYAIVFGRLWQFFTKQALVMKEMSANVGGHVEIDEDVPIELLQDLLAVSIKPKVDPGLEERRAPEIDINPQPRTTAVYDGNADDNEEDEQ